MSGRTRLGWGAMWIAALAMVGTLPGRTQGLGLITEPLLADLGMGRVAYADLNLWATLIGALGAVGVGRLQDQIGSRSVLTLTALALGLSVLAMARAGGAVALFVGLTLTRALGQSALSVSSLTLMGRRYRGDLDRAMAVFSVTMSMGFMVAFPAVKAAVERVGWRGAWSGVGIALMAVLAPVAFVGLRGGDGPSGAATEPAAARGATFAQAARTPAFWTMGLAAAVYGLAASGIGLFNESILRERGFSVGVYQTTLAVTALTSLIGNFLGGWLTRRGGMQRLMAAAMGLLMVALAALPVIGAVWHAVVLAVVMGIAGGFVMVLFFAFWGRAYGERHLGTIQGVAQVMTVLASAVGPLLLAACVARTGSYASAFWVLSGVVGALGIAAWTVRVPEMASRE